MQRQVVTYEHWHRTGTASAALTDVRLIELLHWQRLSYTVSDIIILLHVVIINYVHDSSLKYCR